MKKLILSALLSLSFANTFAATETVATIKEKGGAREIVISQETDGNNQDIVFTLKDRAITKELSRMSYAESADGTELRGKYKTYNFKLAKTGLKTTGLLYKACWIGGLAEVSIIPTVVGGAVLLGSTPAGLTIIGSAVSICTVLPAVPAVVMSLALLPVDALITGTNNLVSPKAIANRKLEKAMSGNDKKASKKAFNLILKRIQDL